MTAPSSPPARSAGRPSVSVLMPSHDHAAFVAAAIDSVAGQTLPPDELLVIDDGSRDDSATVIDRVLARITGIRTALAVRPARGISQTRNELAAAAQGDVLAFLDSDDRYAANRLARLLDRPVDPDRFLAFSGVACRVEGEAEGGRLPARPDSHAWLPTAYAARLAEAASLPTAGFALLRSNLAITASNIVVGRGLFNRVGGFTPGLAISQDWDFLLRCLPFAEPVFVPELLVEYRIHGTNTSRDARGTARGEVAVVVARFGAACLVAGTDNPLCPGPANWPRFFRLFAAVAEMPDGTRLADHLPPHALVAAGAARPPRDAMAIERLVAASQRRLGRAAGTQDAAAGTAAAPLERLLEACRRGWEGQA